MLRLSLAAVFIWFGALKLAGHSPVAALIAATLPSRTPDRILHVLGAVEVLLGVGLLTGRAQRVLLFALAGHLTGTFLTFVDAPQRMFQHGNPLLLTADGEFVLKNVVLISAAMLLKAHHGARRPRAVSAPTATRERRDGRGVDRRAADVRLRWFDKLTSSLSKPTLVGENKPRESARPSEAAAPYHECGTAAVSLHGLST